MTDSYVSGSSCQRVDACPGSAALPRISHSSEKADSGSAFHDHARDRTLMGIGDAMLRIPEHAAKWGLDEKATSILLSRARNWEWSPPRGTMGEVALGLLESGEVVVVSGGRGTYFGPPSLRIATRIDFFWAEPKPLVLVGGVPRCPPESILWGIDFKSGSETWVPPVERNLQALTAAVLPALWTGAKACVPAIVFPTRGRGTWDTLEAPLDEEGIFRARDLLLDVARRANRERAAYAAGRPLRLNEGPHCTYCDSQVYCPAKLATLKAYLENPEPFRGAELTEEELVRLAELAPAFKRFAESVDKALKKAVEARGKPIPLRDGNVWGPYPSPKKVLDPEIAVRCLGETIGDPERAKKAREDKISEASMKRVVKELHEETGVERQVEPTMRAVFRAIYAAEGVGSKTEIWHGPHKPSPAELEALGVGRPRELPPSDFDGVEIDGDPE